VTVEILQSKEENEKARAEMKQRHLGCLSSKFERLLRRIGVKSGIDIGERQKSWDVLKSVEFIEKTLARDEPILDIGAYSSEILCTLNQLNYSRLTGIDLNPNVTKMKAKGGILYVNGDFMNTSFENSSFSAITAISVIEHGLKSRQLLKELSRLLKPFGYFIASIDYWPEKIITDGINVFGADWKIFSRKELLQFLQEAKEFSLVPVGVVNTDAVKKTVTWQGRSYTFAWFVLQKVNLGDRGLL
jgi:SAM-dependent methyltransferase